MLGYLLHPIITLSNSLFPSRCPRCAFFFFRTLTSLSPLSSCLLEPSCCLIDLAHVHAPLICLNFDLLVPTPTDYCLHVHHSLCISAFYKSDKVAVVADAEWCKCQCRGVLSYCHKSNIQHCLKYQITSFQLLYPRLRD